MLHLCFWAVGVGVMGGVTQSWWRLPAVSREAETERKGWNLPSPWQPCCPLLPHTSLQAPAPLHTLTHSCAHWLSLIHSNTHTHFLSVSLSLSVSDTHTLTHAQTHARKRTDTHPHIHTHWNTNVCVYIHRRGSFWWLTTIRANIYGTRLYSQCVWNEIQQRHRSKGVSRGVYSFWRTTLVRKPAHSVTL